MDGRLTSGAVDTFSLVLSNDDVSERCTTLEQEDWARHKGTVLDTQMFAYQHRHHHPQRRHCMHQILCRTSSSHLVSSVKVHHQEKGQDTTYHRRHRR